MQPTEKNLPPVLSALTTLAATGNTVILLPEELQLRESLPKYRYQHQQTVGHGGMGEVSQVYDQDLRRNVAMKKIISRRKQHSGFVGRLIQEAQITGQLEHPNIPPIYDLSLDENESLFYTMKFVEGISLRAVLSDTTTISDAVLQV